MNKFAALVALLLSVALSSCGPETAHNLPSAKSVQKAPDATNALQSTAAPTEQRPTSAKSFRTFASLAPSNTELIYSLNAQDHLVAVCNQCDYPTAAKNKQHIGNFVSVDPEKLVQIHPDGIFLVKEQEGIANTVRKQNIETVMLPNSSVEDVANNVRTIGRSTNKQALAEQLASNFEKSVAAIAKSASSAATHPKVFFCVWPEPLITVGRDSYLNDAVTICGGNNLSANIPGAYPKFSTEKLLMEQPDLIILPDEAHNQTFLNRAPWTSLKAVKDGQVFYLPPRDSDRLSRPTLRLVDGLHWLSKKLHPELHPH